MFSVHTKPFNCRCRARFALNPLVPKQLSSSVQLVPPSPIRNARNPRYLPKTQRVSLTGAAPPANELSSQRLFPFVATPVHFFQTWTEHISSYEHSTMPQSNGRCCYGYEMWPQFQINCSLKLKIIQTEIRLLFIRNKVLPQLNWFNVYVCDVGFFPKRTRLI